MRETWDLTFKHGWTAFTCLASEFVSSLANVSMPIYGGHHPEPVDEIIEYDRDFVLSTHNI